MNRLTKYKQVRALNVKFQHKNIEPAEKVKSLLNFYLAQQKPMPKFVMKNNSMSLKNKKRLNYLIE